MTTLQQIMIVLWIVSIITAFTLGKYMNERDGCIYAGGNYIDKICVNKDRSNGVDFVFNREWGMQQVFWSFSDNIQPNNSFVISQLVSADDFNKIETMCSNITTYNFN